MRTYCKLKNGLIGVILSEDKQAGTVSIIDLDTLKTTCSRFISNHAQEVKEDDIAIIDSNMTVIENKRLD